MIGGGCGGHLIGAGGEAWGWRECVAIQTVGWRVEPETGVALWGVVGQIAELAGGKREGAESFAVKRRRTSRRGKRLGRVAVTVKGVRGSATGVVWWAEGANLEGRRARRRG